MIADNTVRDIDSIEELTLFSLDKSQEGLDILVEDSRKCGEMLDSGKTEEGLRRLYSLVNALHDFDLFENNLCSLFNVDRSQCSDPKGNLEANANTFRTTLQALSAKLENKDFKGLSILLSHDLSESLARFSELMPVLRTHIEQEYI